MAEPRERTSLLSSPIQVIRNLFRGLLRSSWSFASSETGLRTVIAQLR
ncbi:hypothetical protein OG921_19815 [Aldersonia sp. NBC_00410]|nr:hypothetical protein [Aldersonia sp. NBC_00410]MCX5045419.1 hypothetical protein [Aldersonia sp. NBC_00410]